MKNNEEKMIIVEIKPNDGTACPLLDISNEMAPVCTLDNRVPYCKECRKVFSRSEAVGEMANAFIKYDRDCDKSKPLDPYKAMEAALDALLGKEAEK